MPKKQRNGFYFFMKERQDRYSKQGKRVSMKELAEECHPIFRDLSPTEKERYEQMAKGYKNQAEGKLCSDGTSLVLNSQVELERRETLEIDMKAVKRMVFGMESVDDVIDKTFHVVCFNVLCRTDEEEYIPNEVGAVRYSLRRGLESQYQCFIAPGSIPLGYMHACKEHSENTHLIPISGFELAKNNYGTIYRDIVDFVKSNKGAPVFCLKESLEQNQYCLQWLANKAGRLDDESIHFYDVTCLLMELRAYVGKAFPSRAVAVDFLSNHAFDYTPNTRCSYHEELDNAYCALGCAKRLCFMLSDALCSLYDVDCTPKHLPPRVNDKSKMEALQPIFPPSRSFIPPPKLPMQHANPTRASNIFMNLVDNSSTMRTSDADSDTSWMNECCQPQPDVGFDFPSQNNTKPARCEEMRQPSTAPFVLTHAACALKTQYALLGRGRGIGRGKQPFGD